MWGVWETSSRLFHSSKSALKLKGCFWKESKRAQWAGRSVCCWERQPEEPVRVSEHAKSPKAEPFQNKRLNPPRCNIQMRMLQRTVLQKIKKDRKNGRINKSRWEWVQQQIQQLDRNATTTWINPSLSHQHLWSISLYRNWVYIPYKSPQNGSRQTTPQTQNKLNSFNPWQTLTICSCLRKLNWLEIGRKFLILTERAQCRLWA